MVGAGAGAGAGGLERERKRSGYVGAGAAKNGPARQHCSKLYHITKFQIKNPQILLIKKQKVPVPVLV